MNKPSLKYKDREEMYLRATRLFDDSFSVLPDMFNNYYSLNYKRKFWISVIGPWIAHFCFFYISNKDSFFKNHNDTPLDKKNINKIPMSWVEFTHFLGSGEINRQVALQYLSLKNETCLDISNIKLGFIDEKNEKISFLYIFNKYSRKTLRFLIEIMNVIVFFICQLFYKSNLIVVDSSTCSRFDFFKLFIKSAGRIVIFPNLDNLDIVSVFHKRSIYSKGFQNRLLLLDEQYKAYRKTQSDFDLFLCIVILNAPFLSIEGVSLYKKIISKIATHAPKSILLNNGQYSNESIKHAVGHWSSMGTIIKIEQHGAGYGLKKYSSYEFFEMMLSDQFYSWGWGSGVKNIKPFNSIRLSGFNLKSNYNSGNNFLYMCSTAQNEYNESYDYGPIDRQALISNRKKLAKICPTFLGKQIFLRGHPNVGTMYGNLGIEGFNKGVFNVDTSKSFKASLNDKKLVIFESFSTGFFELISNDFPVVIYMPDAETCPWSSNGKKIISILKDAGIIIDSSEKLINFLHSYRHDWWDSRDIFRDSIKSNFCQKSDNYIDLWVNELTFQ